MKRIAIVGAGAIGIYLGARLSNAGRDVVMIARGPSLHAINAQGLRLCHANGASQEHAPSVRAVSHPREAGAQDAVFIALKANQLSEVVADLAPMLTPDTVIVPMVNGVPWWYFHALEGPLCGHPVRSVDPQGHIARHIDAQRIIGCVVYPAAERVAPGVVRVIEGNRFTLGEPDNRRSARIESLSQTLISAGFKAPISKDIRSEIWVKLWGNLCFNPLSALTRSTLQDLTSFALTRQLAAAMMHEAQLIGECLGVRFKVSIEQRIAGAQAVGAHKTSMLQDLEQGRPLELEALVGAVIELGQLTQTPTPHIEAIYAATALLEKTIVAPPEARPNT